MGDTDNKQIAQTTWNKRPDGTEEYQKFYTDGSSSPIETKQGNPPQKEDMIHYETIINNSGAIIVTNEIFFQPDKDNGGNNGDDNGDGEGNGGGGD